MSVPWLNLSSLAWVPGTLVGVLGGLLGALAGTLAPRGKARGLVMGLHAVCLAFSALSLIAGLAALASGQPYGVWYGLVLAGVIGLIVFSSLFPVLRRVYTQAELRKSQAADLPS